MVVFLDKALTQYIFYPIDTALDSSGKISPPIWTTLPVPNVLDPIFIEPLCEMTLNENTALGLKTYLEEFVTYRPSVKAFFAEHGWPILFYTVASNNVNLLSFLLDYGLDPRRAASTAGAAGLPLIAFAVLHASENSVDLSEIFSKLLSVGVDPRTIPEELWIDDNPYALARTRKDSPAWWTPDIRKRLASALTITQVYQLRKADENVVPSERTLQIAEVNKMDNLLKIGHGIVGQQEACVRVFDRIYAHIALKRFEPLVLAFAGPAGHGKTELTELLGKAISATTITVSCAEVRTLWGLFGSEVGYRGCSDGTALNNFLVKNNGKHSIVFLDEFDKTHHDVVEALLTYCEKVQSLQYLHLLGLAADDECREIF